MNEASGAPARNPPSVNPKSVCVYCASSNAADPAFLAALDEAQ